MKKIMKKIIAALCVAVMVLPVAYVPKTVEAATATESDTYKVIGINHVAGATNGIYSQTSGTAHKRLAGISTDIIKSMDGVMFDGLFNFGAGATFTIGQNSVAGHFQMNWSSEGVLSYQFQGVEDTKKTVSKDELGEDITGKDVRIKIGFTFANVDDTNKTADVTVRVKIGTTYDETITSYTHTLYPNNGANKTFEDPSGVVFSFLHALTIKEIKDGTDYQIVSVQDMTGVEEYTSTSEEPKYATDITTFDGKLIDGIYHFTGDSSMNIGSVWSGLQINPAGKVKETGERYLRYQLLEYIPTTQEDGTIKPENTARYGKDVYASDLGCEFYDTDVRIGVGFSYANEETNVETGITTADVTVHIKIGSTYEDIFTVTGYQITNHLEHADTDIYTYLHAKVASPLTLKSGAPDELIEITPADFGVADNTYTCSGSDRDLLSYRLNSANTAKELNFNGKVYSANIQFNANGQSINFGGTGAWPCLKFERTTDSTFTFKNTLAAFTEGAVEIDAANVGLESTGALFNLKIGFEYVDVDFDNDETLDDIKYSLWIDNRLCTEKYSVGIATNERGLVYINGTNGTTISLSTETPSIPDDNTPYILEDFGVKEQVYDAAALAEDGYYYQDIGSVSTGGSSVTGTVSLSGDATLSLYGKTDSAGDKEKYDKIIGSSYIRNVGADGVYTHTTSPGEKQERLSAVSDDLITSLNGVMFDGIFNFASTAYFCVGAGTGSAGAGRFQMQLNDTSLVCQLVGATDAAVTITANDIGEDITGKDVRIKLGFTITDVNEAGTQGTVSVWIKVGDNYETTLTASNHTLTPFVVSGGVIVTIGRVTSIKPVVEEDYTEEGLCFSMTDNGLALNSTFSGLTLNIPYTDVEDSEEFTFTVAEEILDIDKDGSEDDVRFSIWVNGEMYQNKRYYLLDFANKLSKSVYITPGSTDTSNVIVKPSVNVDFHNLDDTENGYLVSGFGVLTVNDESTTNGTLIEKVGDYKIRCAQKGAYVKLVVLYKTGNVHLDEETDVVDVRDLVALKKAVKGASLTTKTAKAGADVDGNKTINATDCDGLRELLVGKELPRRVSYLTHEEGVMPIVGYYGPYRLNDTIKNVSYNHITDDIYKLVKDAGINQISYTNADYRTQPQAVLDSLALAQKYGIGLYVTDTRYTGAVETGTLANYLKDFAKYSSFKGVFVIDEPNTENCLEDYQKLSGKKLDRYADKATMLNRYANTLGYLNMYPQRATSSYEAYDAYIEECLGTKAKMISWDYYVFDDTINGKTEYFKQLSVMRNKSLQKGLPFWGFIQAGRNWNDSTNDLGVTNNNTPTEAQLLWNVNTSLAYGVKGIQYFPLIQPCNFAYEEVLNDGDTGYDYERNGLIGANGVPTKWYDYVQKANKQVATVDEYLLYAETLDVLAVGTTVQTQTGITKEPTYGELLTGVTAANGALVGVFDYQGKTAFYVVNYDTTSAGADKIVLQLGTDKYSVVSTQLSTDVSSNPSTSCELLLNNGGAALVILE